MKFLSSFTLAIALAAAGARAQQTGTATVMPNPQQPAPLPSEPLKPPRFLKVCAGKAIAVTAQSATA